MHSEGEGGVLLDGMPGRAQESSRLRAQRVGLSVSSGRRQHGVLKMFDRGIVSTTFNISEATPCYFEGHGSVALFLGSFFFLRW